MDFVFKQYAPKEAWSLSTLSHGELSWQRARRGLAPDQNGSAILSLEDIRQDARRTKWRRYIIDTYNAKKQTL